jgi:hypothetical protein
MADDLFQKLGLKDVDLLNRPVENRPEIPDYKSDRNSELPLNAEQSYAQAPGETDLDREQVGDMIAASEARTDVKFAHLEGKIDLLIEETRHSRTETAQELSFVRERLAEGREDQRATRNTVLATAIPALIGLAGLAVAVWQGYSSPQHNPQPQVVPAIIYNQPQPQPSTVKALPTPQQNKG